MANVHILDRQGGEFRVVFHIAVPAGNNAANVPWQTALVRSGLGGTTTLPDGDGNGGTISAAEKTSIATGAVYEQVGTIDPTQSGGSVANINAWLDQMHAARVSEVQAALSARLQWFGRQR
jgi:hypothetical protein